jgi:hypothetical protein
METKLPFDKKISHLCTDRTGGWTTVTQGMAVHFMRTCSAGFQRIKASCSYSKYLVGGISHNLVFSAIMVISLICHLASMSFG